MGLRNFFVTGGGEKIRSVDMNSAQFLFCRSFSAVAGQWSPACTDVLVKGFFFLLFIIRTFMRIYFLETLAFTRKKGQVKQE